MMHLPKQAAPVERTITPAASSSENNGVEPSFLQLLPILLKLLGGAG